MANKSITEPIIRLLQDDRKRAIFIFCLTLSSVFWLLSKFSRTYTTTIELPISYENLSDDRIWKIGESPRITLEVEGYGFDLIGYKYRNRNNMVLDFNHIEMRQRRNDVQRSFVQLSELKKDLSDRLSRSVDVISIYPDTLFFPFALRADKPLPVSVRTSVEFKPGFGVNGDIIINPPVVKVSGREQVMDTLKFAYTEALVAKGAADTLSATLRLARLDSTLRFDPPEVDVIIPIEEFTEVSYSIPITIIGLPDSLGLRLFPSSISAICRVPLSRYDELSADDFTATVEYEQISTISGDRVRPNWSLIPEAAKLVRTDPERVEFLILKK